MKMKIATLLAVIFLIAAYCASSKARYARNFRQDIGPALSVARESIISRDYESRTEPAENMDARRRKLSSAALEAETVRKQYRDTSIGSKSDSACNRLSILLNELERTGLLSAGQISSVDRDSMHDNFSERIKSIEHDLP